MRIFRGPDSQKFFHSYTASIKMAEGKEHLLAESFDFSDGTDSWHGEKEIRAKIGKDSNQRNAVAHIIIDESDIMGLYQGLMRGLQEKRRLAEEAASILSGLSLSLSLGLTIGQDELYQKIELARKNLE